MSRRGLSPAAVAEAAAEIADRDGLDAVTVARLAKHLGVRPPSLYNHTGGLDDLRRAVAAIGLRELGDALREATAGRSGDDALVACAEAYRTFAHAHPGRYRALQRAAPADAEQRRAAADLIALLRRLLEPWELTETDAIHAIRALRSCLHGFVDLELTGGFGLDLPLDESYRRLVRGFAAGLGPPAQTAAASATKTVGAPGAVRSPSHPKEP